LSRCIETVARSRRRGGADGEANDDTIVSRSPPIVLGLSPRVFGDQDCFLHQRGRTPGKFFLRSAGFRIFENGGERLRPDARTRLNVVDLEADRKAPVPDSTLPATT
jgi:hypothetical protein